MCASDLIFPVIINSDFGLHNWIFITIAVNPSCSIPLNMRGAEVTQEKQKGLQNLKNPRTNQDSVSGIFFNAIRDH